MSFQDQSLEQFQLQAQPHNILQKDQSQVTSFKNQNQMQIEISSLPKENPETKEKQHVIKQCGFCMEFFSISQHAEHEQICQFIFMSNLSESQSLAKNECKNCKADLNFTTIEQHQNQCLMKELKCPGCAEYFIRCSLDEHANICPKLNSRCSYCYDLFKNYEIKGHQRTCPLNKRKNIYQHRQEQIKSEFEKMEDDGISTKNTCKWCLIEINTFEISLLEHQNICEEKLQLEQVLVDKSQNLAPCQSIALNEIYKKAVQQSFKSIPEVRSHIFQMNYGQDDLFLMRKYIEEMAPVIIHFNMQALHNFVKDTHYRNLFETNNSGGSKSKQSRKIWEDHLFEKHYNGALDSQRVKYGVMNFMNDHQGIASCKNYGSSFMVLNYSVRKRCTITHHRKYGPGEIVGTLKYNFHVLSKFNRKELQALYFASQGFEVQSKDLAFFKQIQIHGPIQFQKDIECIYSPKEEIIKNLEVVKEFEKKFKVPIHPFEDFQSDKQMK